MSLSIGVIGAGIMGADHAQNIHRFIAGADVVVIADPDKGRAEAAIAGIPGARVLTDPEQLITADDVQAVVIASPDFLHADQVKACLESGKHVLVEKPLAYDSATCAEVVAAHRSVVGGGPPRAAVGFMRRFDPGYVAMKAAIGSRKHGRPLMIHSVGRGVSSGPGATNESVIFNSAIHDLDLIPWLLDAPVTEVSWHAGHPSSTATDLADPFLLLVRTADGSLSTVEVFLNARYGYDIRCDAVCETGVLAVTEPAKLLVNANLATSSPIAADWRPRFADAYRLELQEWVDSVREGRPSTLATLEDAERATLVGEAVVESMHGGGLFVEVDR